MNRKQFIAWLKSQGYTGPVELAAAKKWLTEQGYDVESIDFVQGDTVKRVAVDAVWAKAATASMPEEGKKAATITDDADEAKGRIAELEAQIKGIKETARLSGGAPRHGEQEAEEAGGRIASAKSWADRAARKAYNIKAAAGKTAFPDAEMAEVAGAHMRLRIAGLYNLEYDAKKTDLEILGKVHVEYDNNLGGALVPPEISPYMVSLKESYDDPRTSFRQVNMSRDVQTFSKDTGDLTVYAPGEGVAITASTGSVSTVNLQAKKLAALTTVSMELLHDSAINVPGWIMPKIQYAFVKKEQQCFYVGDGTATYFNYQGITNSLLNLSATRANIAGLFVGSGNLFSELVLTDFEAVVARLPDFEGQGGDPHWEVNKRFYFEVMVKLALAAGGVTAAEIEGKRTPMFLGYPVKFRRSLPRADANDQVCALFGWPELAATVGDVAGGITISQSDQRYFDQDLIAFKGTKRVAFSAHDVGNASATEASRTPGPVVGLLTAAS